MKVPTTNSASREKEGIRVTLCGLGNLGSHLVGLLAGMPGISSALVLDLDVCEERNRFGQLMGGPENVGRPKAVVQAERMRAMNPLMRVDALVADLRTVPMGRLRADLIVAGLDSLQARMALNQIAWRLGIPWLDGGVDPKRWLGRVNGYWPGRSRPCIECGLSDLDYRQGLPVRQPCQPAPEVEPTGGTHELGAFVASLLAVECARWIEGNGRDSLFDRQLLVDLRHHRHFVTRIQANHGCRFDHETWEPALLPGMGPGSSLRELFNAARDQAGFKGDALLSLENHSFATRLCCPACFRQKETFCLPLRLSGQELLCPDCGKAEMMPVGMDMHDALGVDMPEEWMNRTLQQVRLMQGDIVTLREGGQCLHLEIGGPVTPAKLEINQVHEGVKRS